MTGPISSVAARETRVASRPDMREAGLWAIGIVGMAFWANVLRGDEVNDLSSVSFFMNRVLDNGAFDVLAWMQIAVRGPTMFDRGEASWKRCGGVLLLGVIALAPVWLATGVDLLILGVWLRRDRCATDAGRQNGLILLACALEVLSRSRLVSQVHVVTANLDAAMCALILRPWYPDVVAHGNFVTGASPDFTIAILPFCASSMPLAGVCLAFITVSLHLGRAPRRRDLGWFGLAMLASIALTEGRLALMATGEDTYHWWHDGTGVTVYALAAVALAILFPALAQRDLWIGATRRSWDASS